MRTFTLTDYKTRQLVTIKEPELLAEINRNKSDDWTDYTADTSDDEIAEALAEWTDYALISISSTSSL